MADGHERSGAANPFLWWAAAQVPRRPGSITDGELGARWHPPSLELLHATELASTFSRAPSAWSSVARSRHASRRRAPRAAFHLLTEAALSRCRSMPCRGVAFLFDSHSHRAVEYFARKLASGCAHFTPHVDAPLIHPHPYLTNEALEHESNRTYHGNFSRWHISAEGELQIQVHVRVVRPIDTPLGDGPSVHAHADTHVNTLSNSHVSTHAAIGSVASMELHHWPAFLAAVSDFFPIGAALVFGCRARLYSAGCTTDTPSTSAAALKKHRLPRAPDRSFWEQGKLERLANTKERQYRARQAMFERNRFAPPASTLGTVPAHYNWAGDGEALGGEACEEACEEATSPARSMAPHFPTLLTVAAQWTWRNWARDGEALGEEACEEACEEAPSTPRSMAPHSPMPPSLPVLPVPATSTPPAPPPSTPPAPTPSRGGGGASSMAGAKRGAEAADVHRRGGAPRASTAKRARAAAGMRQHPSSPQECAGGDDSDTASTAEVGEEQAMGACASKRPQAAGSADRGEDVGAAKKRLLAGRDAGAAKRRVAPSDGSGGSDDQPPSAEQTALNELAAHAFLSELPSILT